jgi:hypothetical protein
MEMTKGMQKVIGKAILDLPMKSTDTGATSVHGYLQRLLRAVWIEEEDFDGKRPFGNYGWQEEIYETLVFQGFLAGTPDGMPDSDVDAEELVLLAIDQM